MKSNSASCNWWQPPPVQVERLDQLKESEHHKCRVQRSGYNVQRPGPASCLVSLGCSTTGNYNHHQHHPDKTSTAWWMTSATAICNGVIQTLRLLSQLITPVWYISVLWLDPAYSTIYVGVTLCLQSKCWQSGSKCSTEETICAGGRLASYIHHVLLGRESGHGWPMTYLISVVVGYIILRIFSQNVHKCSESFVIYIKWQLQMELARW